jgi:hypothetical protein
MHQFQSDGHRQRNITRRTGIALCVALLAAACSDDAPPGDEAVAADAVVDEVTDGQDAASDPATDGSGLGLEEETGADDPVVVESPPRPDLGQPTIQLATPARGGGPWPELAWRGVDGADSYTVTLYDVQGGAYWAWSGAETSVVVGGFASVPPEGSGVAPRVQPGMSWDVTAHGDDGGLIAQSGERPIGP